MGFDMAMSEISLVLFTTIAPSGAVAVALMALLSLSARSNAEAQARIDQCAWVPLAITLVGLVSSATHLGNPANALYVLLGVGSSPLSNEVSAAVVFLGLAGVRWMLSFARRPLRTLKAALSCLTVVAAVVFVTAVAFAYDAATVPTWNTPYVPASLWLNALCGGPALMLATMQWARPECVAGGVRAAALAASAVGLCGSVVMYVLQNGVLQQAENALVSGAQLVPHYPAMIVAFAVLAAVGLAIVARACFARQGAAPSASGARSVLVMDIVGCTLVFAGIFVARFAFYMMHMTV